MKTSEKALEWVRDAVIVAALFAAPLLWGFTPGISAIAYQSAGLAVTCCLMAIGFLAYLAQALLFRRELRWVRTPLNLPLLLLIAIAIVSTAFASVNHYRSKLEVCKLLAGAMVFWLIANQPPSVARRRCYVGALVVAATVEAWLGGREYVSQLVREHNSSWRIFATFLNPNELAGYLGLAIPLAAAAYLWARSASGKILAGFATLLTVVAMALTGSRGGWISLVAGLYLFALLAGIAFRRTRLAAIVSLLCLGVILAAALAVPPLRARLTGSLAGGNSDMFRRLTWQGTERIVAEHPWLGVGPGAFEFIYPKYARGGVTRMAHQNYLQMAAETGVAGGVAFIWLLLAFFWLAGKGFRRASDLEARLLYAACIAGVLAFSIHSLFDYGWYIGAIALSVFALFGLAANLSAPAPVAVPPRVVIASKRRRRERATSTPIVPPIAEVTAPISILSARSWRLRLSQPAALIALVVVATTAGLLSAWPVRAYMADNANRAGRLASAQGNRGTAEGYFRAAVRLQPDCGEYWRELGSVIGVPRGIEDVERAAQLEPTNVRNPVALATMYELVGPYSTAARYYRQAISLDPNYLVAYRRLAELEARLGNPANALTLYRKMVAIENSDFERYKALNERVEIEYAYAHYSLGGAALAQGDAATARSELEHALQVWDDRNGRGRIMDQAAQAVGEYTSEIEQEMARLRARILWRLGEAYERLGDAAKADKLRVDARTAWPAVKDLVAQEPSLVVRPKPANAPSRPDAAPQP